MNFKKDQKLTSSKNYRQRLHHWFVVASRVGMSNPWQAIYLLTRRLRSLVALLIAVATIGTGITIFVFFFPLRLFQWLPVLQGLLSIFFIGLLLFVYFRQQGNNFYLRFFDEVLQLNNAQGQINIPRDKRKILRQFEWYSQGQILKVNFIALGLATIFLLAPRKVIDALGFRKQTVSEQIQKLILKKHQQIAYLKTLNEQNKLIVSQSERTIRHHQKYIKRLKVGMQKHYRQIIELRRYRAQLNRVRRQINALKKIGHTEVWKQERLVKSNALVMAHVKGLVQARLEQKEKPVNQADAMLSKYGTALKVYRDLLVRYQKLENRTNTFSYKNATEVKKAKNNIIQDQQFIQTLQQEIDKRKGMITALEKDVRADEKNLTKWKLWEKIQRERVK